MNKKPSPNKDRRTSLKRTHHKESNIELDEAESAKKNRTSHDIDLSDILTVNSDTEEDIVRLFDEKFQEKSPASKLSGSFRHVGLNESNLFKKPRLSLTSHGRRSIGLTAAEREQKRKMSRSLDYSSVPTFKSPLKPRHRSVSRSPKK